MTVYNFNWFLHAMLFIHTQQVIKKQMLRDNKEGDQDEDGIDIEEEEQIYATMYVWYEFVSMTLAKCKIYLKV